MLQEKMLAKLNEQIAIEFESSNLYLQMSAWCAHHGLDGCATFLRVHSQEEMMHMFKLFDYVLETDALAELRAMEKPRTDWKDILEIFEATLKHERFVTGSINELVSTAYELKDYSTLNFLQWYVAEQHEEEALFSKIVDMVRMVGDKGQGLFLLDREIGAMAGPPVNPSQPPAQ